MIFSLLSKKLWGDKSILAKKVSSARRHTNHQKEGKCFREAAQNSKKIEKKAMTLHATVKGYDESGTNRKGRR